ncbi:MAG TPA: RNA methyltransferase [Microvirga sp.]|jgi:tRNA G18 (ribose-2'-O)-methylase SpoU|nr:RNA methyltransferase [Microvirga sp.]
MLVPITDPDDPRIEPYRAVRERDLAGRRERFIAEGEVVLRVLLTRSRFAAESLLIAEGRVRSLSELLAGLPAETPVYVAAPLVMDAIVGFPIHRGVLAVGRRLPVPPAADLLRTLQERALVVGLVGLANHDNVGGVFRNAAAFGANAVLLDAGTCDPLYRKAIRVSVGGSLIVPFGGAPTGEVMLDALREAGFETFAMSPAGARTLSGVRPAPRSALLLGAEGPGLPEAVLSRARTVTIPMAGGFDSLNVATTSGIALHHLTAAR